MIKATSSYILAIIECIPINRWKDNLVGMVVYYLYVRHTNSMTNVHYRMMLAVIDTLSTQNPQFSARTVFQYITNQLSQPVPATTIKIVSNDLSRLYRMQLLSRKRVKRPVSGGEGEFKGYMYTYYLNKQGRSYVDYLKRTFYWLDFQEYCRKFLIRTDWRAAVVLNHIESNFNKKMDDLDETYAEYVYFHLKSKISKNKRFPTRISFEFVKKLMERKQRLEQENEQLKNDLKVCQMNLEMTKRRLF